LAPIRVDLDAVPPFGLPVDCALTTKNQLEARTTFDKELVRSGHRRPRGVIHHDEGLVGKEGLDVTERAILLAKCVAAVIEVHTHRTGNRL